MTIYFADLDNNIVDQIVLEEKTDSEDRVSVAAYAIIEAFNEIAGDNRVIADSDHSYALNEMAFDTARDWVMYFNSRPDRRATFFRMFPKAEELIALIPPKPSLDIYKDVERRSDEDDTLEDFINSIDMAGFPYYWSNSVRQHAMDCGYTPSVVRDPAYNMTLKDMAWIKSLEQDYHINNP